MKEVIEALLAEQIDISEAISHIQEMGASGHAAAALAHAGVAGLLGTAAYKGHKIHNKFLIRLLRKDKGNVHLLSAGTGAAGMGALHHAQRAISKYRQNKAKKQEKSK